MRIGDIATIGPEPRAPAAAGQRDDAPPAREGYAPPAPAKSWFAGLENLRRRATARLARRMLGAGSAADARLPRTSVHRVLVCRNVHTLGDSLTLTPLLTELARVYPGAEVDILSSCPVADALYAAFPNVRTLYRLPRHIAGHLLASAGAVRAMRRIRYDLAIDPDPQSQSGRVLALWAHAWHTLGYVGPGKSGRLTHGVAVPAYPRHKAMTCVYLLRRALGEDPDARPYPTPTLRLTRLERARARGTLARLVATGPRGGTRAPRIGVFAYASGGKLLAREWWDAFIEAFQRGLPDCRIVEILPGFGQSLLGDRFPCFYSSDVRKLAAVIANLDAFVSADCGVMHVAWAAGTPTVGLFNVTDPVEWGPFGPGASALDIRAATPAQAARDVLERLRHANPAA